MEYYEAVKAFSEYEDANGLYVLDAIQNCTKENEFVWKDWPPETFKILVYFPETETFFVSPICERYAFDSYYTVDLSQRDNNGIYANPVYHYTVEAIKLIVRIAITCLIEVGLAWLWKYRVKKRSYSFWG